MLSDDQLDRLEQAINSSTLNDLPNLLTRLIPALFAELRLARETIRERTDEFLAAAREVPRQDHDTEGVSDSDSRLVPIGPQHHAVSIEVSDLPEITGEVPADSGGAHKKTTKATSRNARRKRKSPGHPGSEGQVVAGDEVPKVGGQVRPEENAGQL
jgi:hypothetical protein